MNYLQQKLYELWQNVQRGLSLAHLLILVFYVWGTHGLSAATRYEAESANIGNVTVASTYAGYSGSGYVTNTTSEWSRIAMGVSNSQTQSAQLDIRFSNGNGSNITNLALYVGSTKIQDLVFPNTTNWTTWSTLTVYFTLPAGYQEVIIRGTSNASNTVNIDYSDLTLGVSSTPPGSFSQSSPAAGATGVSTTPSLSWSSATNVTSYALVVSTSSSYNNPVVNVSNLTGTSYTIATALANNTQYYWKVTAVNANGSTVASNAGISFTTQAAPTAPGTFTQSAPASGATNVSTTPTFTWATSSGEILTH
ncbi:MAG: carbohydrate-binding protein [Saprospiraceae bacterium]